MWHLKFSKRDFVEFWLGSNKKIIKKAQRISYAEPAMEEDVIHAYWREEPSIDYFFPSTIVATDSVLNFIFTAVNSSPSASAPVSAFSRIVLSSDAESYFSSSPMKLSDSSIAAIVSVSMAEATMHSEGRLGLRQLSSAACKRTLAYAWGKALTARTAAQNFDRVADRWFDTYGLINSQVPSDNLRHIVSAEIGALNAYAQISIGLPPTGEAANLAYTINRKDRDLLSSYWSRLSGAFGFEISLDALSQSTREERGTYLQEALLLATSSHGDEPLAAICAFIATQVAPGSLEHLELLKQSGNPEIVFWYALYAALQSPNEIMAALGGLGYKIYRDIACVEDQLSSPTSDISYEELKALERSGIESLAKKFGHVGVVEVELLPLVTSSFSYGLKQAKVSRNEAASQASEENDRYGSSRISYAHKLKLEQAIVMLSQLANELPSGGDDMYGSSSSRRSTKRKL
ncbi:hypothetical protein [Pseudomonas sp. HY7a-MNA-CIBAN-0227]|uniref:hypothetical protein n=1 Tax=Pseudomonas sp. HY7a-MNA-CIBAN-0227 TaxID=3140474 RepID=UPI00333348C5